MSVNKQAVDQGWSWVVLIAAFTGVSITSVINITGIYNLVFLEEFGKSQVVTAWVLSIHSCLHALIGPIASLMINAIGARKTVFVGTTMTALGYFLCAFSNNFTMVFLTYGILSGAGFSFAFIPGFTMIGFYFDKYRNIAYGIASMGFGVGAFVLAPVLSYIIQEYGWKGSMILTSGLVMHLFIVGAVLRPVRTVTDEKTRLQIEDCEDININDNKPEYFSKNQEKSLFQSKIDKFEDFTEGSGSASPKQDHKMIITVASDKDVKNETDQNLKEPLQKNRWLVERLSKLEYDSNGITNSQPNLQSILERKCIFNSIDNVEHCHKTLQRRILENYTFSRMASDLILQSSCSSSINLSVHHVHTNPDSIEPFENKIVQEQSFIKRIKTQWVPLVNAKFLLLLANLFFVDFGLAIVYVHYPAFVVSQGASLTGATHIISIMGISNISSRLLTVLATTDGNLDMLTVYIGSCGITGIVLCLIPVTAVTYSGQIINAFLFGLYSNCFTALMVPLAIEYVGLDSSVAAYGVMECICGVRILLGPPVAGLLYDLTHSYAYIIILAGVAFLAGAMTMMIIPLCEKKQDSWKGKCEMDTADAGECKKPFI